MSGCVECMSKRDKNVELQIKVYCYATTITEEEEEIYKKIGYPVIHKIYYKCPECNTCYEKGYLTGMLHKIPRIAQKWLKLNEHTITK